MSTGEVGGRNARVAEAARAGTQIGEGVYARVNRMPRAASASRLGVCTSGCPAQPIARAWCSSDMMISRFVVTSRILPAAPYRQSLPENTQRGPERTADAHRTRWLARRTSFREGPPLRRSFQLFNHAKDRIPLVRRQRIEQRVLTGLHERQGSGVELEVPSAVGPTRPRTADRRRTWPSTAGPPPPAIARTTDEIRGPDRSPRARSRAVITPPEPNHLQGRATGQDRFR